MALHGYESGRIVRLPGGEYIEVHEQLDEYERWRLVSYNQYSPLVIRPDEGLEEGPGLAGHQAQKRGLLRREPRLRARQRPAEPPRQQRGHQPQQQDRRGHRQRFRP